MFEKGLIHGSTVPAELSKRLSWKETNMRDKRNWSKCHTCLFSELKTPDFRLSSSISTIADKIVESNILLAKNWEPNKLVYFLTETFYNTSREDVKHSCYIMYNSHQRATAPALRAMTASRSQSCHKEGRPLSEELSAHIANRVEEISCEVQAASYHKEERHSTEKIAS